jgi:ABC-type transporter Mla subunit MlaD
MKLIFVILLSLFSLKSCVKDPKNINVVLDDANGLQDGSKVTCKGLEVGKVNNLKIVGDKVIALVDLNEDFTATKGSVAQVDIDNIFGKKSLLITPSSNTEILANGDTIYAVAGNNYTIIKNIIKKGGVDSLMGDLSLDSLNINLDSIDVEKYLKQAEKFIDLNKLLK